MNFESMIIKNFRQFENEQEIQFGAGPQGRITLIEGENASGKTTLLRALRWALFGSRGVELFERPLFGSALLPDRILAHESEGSTSQVQVTVNGIQDGGGVQISRFQDFYFTGQKETPVRIGPESSEVTVASHGTRASMSRQLRALARQLRQSSSWPDPLEGWELGPKFGIRRIWDEQGFLPLVLDCPFDGLDRNVKENCIRHLKYIQRQMIILVTPIEANEYSRILPCIGKRWRIDVAAKEEGWQCARLVEVPLG